MPFWLLITANIVLNSPVLVALMTEVISLSETSVPTRATRNKVPEGGMLLHSNSLRTVVLAPVLQRWPPDTTVCTKNESFNPFIAGLETCGCCDTAEPAYIALNYNTRGAGELEWI
jgi:hypothetical protein